MEISNRQRNILTWTISIAFFIEIMDSTILNTSLPQIAKSFMVNPILLKVALISYLVSVGLFLPLSSYVADLIGTKRLFIIANIIFCLGSIGSGFSHHISTLTLFRILQGLGGAFLTPVARLILIKIYPKGELVKGQAFAATLASLAMLMGPVLGGAITTFLNWRFIFFINVPMNIIAILISLYKMPNFKEQARRLFDGIGFLCIAISLASLLFLFDNLNSNIINTYSKIALAIIPVLGIISYIVHSKKLSQPLFDHELWTHRHIIQFLCASFILRIALNAIPFLIPLLLQASYGFSAFHAGLILMCSAIGFGLAKLFIVQISHHLSSKKLLMCTHVILFLCVTALTTTTWALNWWILGGILLLFGLSTSLSVSTLNVYIYQQAPRHLSSQLITLNSSSIQLSASFAIAISASYLTLMIGHSGMDQLHLPSYGFHTIFIFETLFILISMALIGLKIKRPVSSRQP